MDAFAATIADRRRDIEARASQARSEYPTRSRRTVAPLVTLKDDIARALSRRWGGDLRPQFDPIDREQFGGDLALKFPQLLRDGGPKGFAVKHQPWIVEELSAPGFHSTIAQVRASGMYVNVTLTDSWLLTSARDAVEADGGFGLGTTMQGRTFIVDYSSPNVAKELHAGHIRSTIVGHVLSNLYSAAGALVHRVNHINDFGGFGYVLEGWRRFAPAFETNLSMNDRLLEIYRIRRVLERVSAGVEPTDDDEQRILHQYSPGRSTTELRAEFDDFTRSADARFAALTRGDPDEVDLWKSLVDHSLSAFDEFYHALNVEFDFVIGESFYARHGRDVVRRAVDQGTARVFTESDADVETTDLQRRRERDDITDREYESAERAVRKDIGATVVPLGHGERLVVLRRDGHDIYATRDLGAISLRRDVFDPTDIVYVVGQEQQVHFDRVFRAAEAIGAVDRTQTSLRHIYFGFYVDARTGRKLSSRDSAANVMHLLSRSYEHFLDSLSDRASAHDGDPRSAARQLAIGSLVFNDLQKDMRASVEIDSSNIDATIAGFEKSGGAYVVYAAVRAGNVLRRSEELPRVDDVGVGLDHQECRLLIMVQRFPTVAADAAEASEPAIVVRYLKDLASLYSSYYARAQVIEDGVASTRRLSITKAVYVTLRNGLRLCHVEAPRAM